MAEGVSSRITRLNQLLSGKTPGRKVPLLDKETLLDAFMVLYNECSTEFMTKDKNIATYAKKFKPLICELEKLRLKKSDFEIRKTIGRGHFGEVHVVREKVTGNVYAMKVLQKSATLSQDNVAFFEEERDIMAFANNPWITSLQYAFQDYDNLYFVMDFHPGGDLLSLLAKYEDIFEEDVARFYLAEMIMAMHAVHALGYVHRDVKPENVLIDRLGHVKLADFGSSARLSNAKTVISKMPVGTPEYIAPEVLMCMDGSGGGGKYGLECDWWSLGVVAYEMMIGNTPFQADSVVVVYSQIMNFKNSLIFPDDEPLTDNAKHLIRSLLTDQNTRVGYADLAKHPFFSGLDWTTLQNDVPPYVPNIQREDDTSNFDDFETEHTGPRLEDLLEQKKGFVGKDLPFIGFTFTKQLTLASLTETCGENENINNSIMNRSMSVKRVSANDASGAQVLNLKSEIEKEQKKNKELKHQIEEKMKNNSKLVQERDSLSSEKLLFNTEKQDLERRLNSEKTNREKLEIEVTGLREEVGEGGGKADTQLKSKYEEQQQTLQELENEKTTMTRSVQQLGTDLTEHKQLLIDSETRSKDLQTKLAKATKDHNSNVSEMQQNMTNVTGEYENRIKQMQEKLNKSTTSSQETSDQLLKIEAEKIEMEKKIAELKTIEGLYKQQETDKETCNIEGMTTLQNNLSEKKSECKRLEKELKKVKEELEEGNTRYDNLVRFGEDLKASVERKIEKLKREVESSKKEQKNLTDDYEKAKDSLEESKNTIKTKDMKISSLQVSCDSFEKQLSNIMNDTNIDTTGVDEKIKEERLTRQMSELSSERLKFEGELDKLNNELLDSQKETSKYKNQFEEAQKQIEENMENYEANINKLNREMSKITEENNKSQKELINSRKSFEEMDEKYTKFRAKSKSEKATHDKKDLEGELKKANANLETLKTDKKAVESKFQLLHDELTKLRKGKKQMEDDLSEKERQASSHELTIHMLRQTCTMLEGQVEELEVMNDEYQDRESQWNLVKRQQYQTQERLEQQYNDALASIEQQRQLKNKAEEKIREIEDRVSSTQSSKKMDELDKIIIKHQETIQELNASVSTSVTRDGLNAVTIKKLESKLASATEENDRIVSEISHLQELSSQQSKSNFELSQNIEILTQSNEEAMTEKEKLQNQIERTSFSHAEEKIKIESTMAQQRKLIEFLQKKMDDRSFQPGGKKKFNFGNRKQADAPSPAPAAAADNRKMRDLEKGLDKEKNAALQLHLQLQKARDELAATKCENQQLKASLKSVGDSPTPPPQAKPPQPSGLKTPGTSSTSSIVSRSGDSPLASIADIYQMAENEVRGIGSKPFELNLKDEFPHNMQASLNMRAGKCPVCLNVISFAKQTSKCQACNIICHSSCIQSLSNTCGVSKTPINPALNNRNSMVLDDGSVAIGITDGLQLSKIEGWLKYPKKSGTKQNWERKWVVLQDMKLSIYDNENTIEFDPFDEIDNLNISGELNIHPSIPASELIWASANDIQYVFSIELLPFTLGWPRRTLYFLAPTFADKQKWVTSLECIGDEVKKSTQRQGHGMADDVILTLENNQLILNCATTLSETGAILGCEDGLYVVSFKPGSQQNKPVHIVGLGPVYQLTLVRELGIAVLIAGKERVLCYIEVIDLENRLKQLQTGSSISAINSHQIDKVKGCHLFIVEKVENDYYVCAATSRKLNVLKFQSNTRNFTLKKEVETSEPSTCLLLTSNSAIFGTSKFYTVDLKNYQKRDLLDASDTSLAFAVFGTSQTQSFPIAIFNIGEGKSRDEYLLCYNQFGIFVDWQGRRSRKGDLKWSRLPLSFDYRCPHLYISHYASIEICEIPGDVKADINTIARRFVDVPDPRFVGTGLTTLSLLFSSTKRDNMELISYQATLSQLSRNHSTTSAMSLSSNSTSSGFESMPNISVEHSAVRPDLSSDVSRTSSTLSIGSDEDMLNAAGGGKEGTTPKGKRKENLRTQEKDKNRISFRFFKANRKSQNYDA